MYTAKKYNRGRHTQVCIALCTEVLVRGMSGTRVDVTSCDVGVSRTFDTIFSGGSQV